jgi:hypothetical protein
VLGKNERFVGAHWDIEGVGVINNWMSRMKQKWEQQDMGKI